MKKVLIASAALFIAAITNVNAQTTQAVAEKKEVVSSAPVANATVVSKVVAEKNEIAAAQPAKTPVKPDALPAEVKSAIAGEDYKGWVVSEAFLVKDKVEYYEVVLNKDKETKTVKMDKSGKLLM